MICNNTRKSISLGLWDVKIKSIVYIEGEFMMRRQANVAESHESNTLLVIGRVQDRAVVGIGFTGLLAGQQDRGIVSSPQHEQPFTVATTEQGFYGVRQDLGRANPVAQRPNVFRRALMGVPLGLIGRNALYGWASVGTSLSTQESVILGGIGILGRSDGRVRIEATDIRLMPNENGAGFVANGRSDSVEAIVFDGDLNSTRDQIRSMVGDEGRVHVVSFGLNYLAEEVRASDRRLAA